MHTLERALAIAQELAEGWLFKTETSRPEPNRLDITLASPADLVPFVVGLRVQRLGYLAAITGMDLGPEKGELELLYHFCPGPAVITLRVRLPREDAQVDSLTAIIPSAEASERELAEMFGVRIEGLRAPEHLYLPDDWPDRTYPLRKDFELAGQA
jgi:NADH:ubiquinone oxidoreductase subunit C